MLLRLPDILEVHGIIKPWKPRDANEAPKTEVSQQPPATTGVSGPPGTFDAQHVGANGGGSADERVREHVWGAQTVGGSGAIPQERE